MGTMAQTQHHEMLRLEPTRNGRCNFLIARPQSEEIGRAATRALQANPTALGEHIPHLIERLNNGQALSLGDASQLLKIKPLLAGLSCSGEKALALLEQNAPTMLRRYQTRSMYLHSPKNNRPNDAA